MGPFSSVEKTSGEIKVPINPDTMDEEAERFFCEAIAVGLPLKNLLAVCQEAVLGNYESLQEVGPTRFLRTQESSKPSFSSSPCHYEAARYHPSARNLPPYSVVNPMFRKYSKVGS